MAERAPQAASASDLVAVVALVEAAGLPTEGIPDAFPGGYAVVRIGPEIVAAAGLEVHGEFGLLRSVAVQPGHRRSGLGRILVADRLHFAKQRSLQAVYLLTSTAPEGCCQIALDARGRAVSCVRRPDGKTPDGCCS